MIRETVQKIESEISVMNYDSWLRIKNPNNYDEVLLLLLKNERKSYRKSKMDIETFCMPFLKTTLLLEKCCCIIKSNLADVFSKYLLLPRINTNPKIEYTCNQTDICELIFAISNESKITGSEKLKAILMDMFEISGEVYKNAKFQIINRGISKSRFMEKLSENLNKIPSSKLVK
ncbi:MAG: RteC domain-containing protein [Chitinophagaceae bacterium]|nr:RteC domain-containing protein [Chitinophagaceae bacterium]